MAPGIHLGAVYSVTLSSSVKFVSPNTGIRWQDGTVSTTAAGFGGGGGAGALTLIEAQAPSSTNSITFTGLSPGVIYRLVLSLTQNDSNATYSIRFNGDTGSFYRYAVTALDSNNGTLTDASNGTSAGVISYANVVAGGPLLADLTFTTAPGDDTVVVLTGTMSYWQSLLTSARTSVYWNGSTNLANITLRVGAGTFTGKANLYRFQ